MSKKKKTVPWRYHSLEHDDAVSIVVAEEVQTVLARLWFSCAGEWELNGFGLVREIAPGTFEWYRLYLFSGESSYAGVTSDPTIFAKAMTEIAMAGEDVTHLRLFWHFHPASLGPSWSTTDEEACAVEVDWANRWTPAKSNVIFNVVCSGIDAKARFDRPFAPGETPEKYIRSKYIYTERTVTTKKGKPRKFKTSKRVDVEETETQYSRSISILFPQEETDEFKTVKSACEAGSARRYTYTTSLGYGSWTGASWLEDSRDDEPIGSRVSQPALPMLPAADPRWEPDPIWPPEECPVCGAGGCVIEDEKSGDVWLCESCEAIINTDGTVIYGNYISAEAVNAAYDDALTVCPNCGKTKYDAYAGFCWQCRYAG